VSVVNPQLFNSTSREIDASNRPETRSSIPPSPAMRELSRFLPSYRLHGMPKRIDSESFYILIMFVIHAHQAAEDEHRIRQRVRGNHDNNLSAS
jgi:hypothetical protein